MPQARYEQLDIEDGGYRRFAQTWCGNMWPFMEGKDFDLEKIMKSREVFTPESIEARKPVTKEFEVWAFVWGLPFHQRLVNELVEVQGDVEKILGDTMTYFVKPQNEGTELFRLKMPEDKISDEEIQWARRSARDLLSGYHMFQVEYAGIGITPEGVLVAKGYDPTGAVPELRRKMACDMTYASKNQITWVHSPMARILEQVGPEKFQQLRDYCFKNARKPLGDVVVGEIKLVHETQWYGERKQIVEAYKLCPGNVV